MSFWGEPKHEPNPGDVARFLEVVRTLTEKQTPDRKLRLATSALHAICAFICKEFGPKEMFAITDKIRAGVTVA